MAQELYLAQQMPALFTGVVVFAGTCLIMAGTLLVFALAMREAQQQARVK